MSKKPSEYSYSYSFSWKQPYTNWQPWIPPQLSPYNEDMMDSVEEKVSTMTDYPDAEAIIKKVQNGTNS